MGIKCSQARARGSRTINTRRRRRNGGQTNNTGETYTITSFDVSITMSVFGIYLLSPSSSSGNEHPHMSCPVRSAFPLTRDYENRPHIRHQQAISTRQVLRCAPHTCVLLYRVVLCRCLSGGVLPLPGVARRFDDADPIKADNDDATTPQTRNHGYTTSMVHHPHVCV